MTCCCQSIHQRRRCESTAGGIQMRLLCGLPGGSWKIERGCSHHGSVENALQMKGVTTVKPHFSLNHEYVRKGIFVGHVLLFVHELFNGELKILMKPNPKLKDLGWIRQGLWIQNVFELEKVACQKAEQVSTFSKV